MPTVNQRPPRPGSAVRPQGQRGYSARPGGESGGPGLKLAVAGTLLAMAALGYSFWAREPEQDPNFVRARDAVATYELGKDEDARNYDDPVYPEALTTLARVAPDSISAQPAEQLAVRIRQSVDLFHQRLKAGRDDMAERERKVKMRFEADMMANTRARLTPDNGSPECKDEEEGHAHSHKDGHGH